MPLPDIFEEGPPSEAKLARYFEEMYEYLIEEGVPEDRLPSPWHMLSRMVKCLDTELMREWLDAYVAIEAEEDADSEDEDADLDLSEGRGQRPKPKRRPSYLRALEASKEDSEDVQKEAPTEDSRDDGS